MEDSMTKEEFTTVMQLIRMLIESSSSVEECLKKFDDLAAQTDGTVITK